MWDMIKQEFRHIGKNRLLCLSVVVMCFIPLLYSIFFLKSVWNPYGMTENLPVAVVNKDVPVDYQGHQMAVGKQTVAELKKNDQLDWHFVSAKKAHQGISHRKYYTVITIPKNFSQNATTVLDKHPHKMHLTYQTNDSLNYLGQVVSTIGVNSMNTRIREAVTSAYATAMFKALKTVSHGMRRAANGADQLHSGIVTLNDGMNQYVAGVSQVNNGVQTLAVGVQPLASGASQLANGGSQLANGINQYAGGVGQLNAGLGQLSANSGRLNAGADQLSAAGSQLSGLASQTALLMGQLNTLNSAAGNLTGIMGQLQNATALQSQVNSLQGQLTQMHSLLQGLNGLDTSQLKSVISMMQNSDGKSGTVQLQSALKSVAGNASDSASQAGAIKAAVDGDKNASAATKSTVDAAVGRIQSDASNTSSSLSGLNGAASNNGQSGDLKAASSQLSSALSQLEKLQAALPQINSTMNNAQALMNQTSGLLNSLNSPALQQLATEMPAMQGSLQSLTAQAGNLQALAGSASQLNVLANGIHQYTAGVDTAAAGSAQLNANSPTLVAGANTIANALNSLNAQVPALVAGVNQLAAGTAQLAANSPALINGINRLNSGAAQLASSLGNGAKAVNNVKGRKQNARMIGAPTKVKHTRYSYVPNYGHALAPYVLSVALYVGCLIFNFIYPIRRVSKFGESPAAWWASKVIVGVMMGTLMAIAECSIMMALGLNVIHVPSYFATTICFAFASMGLIMFLSMTFDNPGRFVAMVGLMLQLGGSGGTFPMQLTMKFYNIIHPYLPMTYSILGLRDSISGGLGQHYVLFCNSINLAIGVVFFLLMLGSMYWLQHHHFAGKSELDHNQQLQELERDDDGMHLQSRDQTI